MDKKVFKFGGASVKDAISYRNVYEIISEHSTEEIQVVVVLSAMGKMTNQLEWLIASICQGNTDISLAEEIFDIHKKTAEELEVWTEYQPFWQKIKDDVFSFIENHPSDNDNYIYDQVVCTGEMLSTHLLYSMFLHQGVDVGMILARDMIITDSNYTDANIKWQETEEAIKKSINEATHKLVITQGFVGADKMGNYTTLGREGSDYTAAIISKILDVDEMTIWKDVNGVYTSDPKLYPEATLIPKLSYNEAIEMTYYGAQVIHPKTIQPIKNSNCVLKVRSFIDKQASGTDIGQFDIEHYEPVIVKKTGQVLYTFSTKDFSFINESNLSKIIAVFGLYSLRINLMQNTAIQFVVLTDDKIGKNEKIMDALQDSFIIQMKKDLTLLTIRHYTESLIKAYRHMENLILIQKDKKTIQYLMN